MPWVPNSEHRKNVLHFSSGKRTSPLLREGYRKTFAPPPPGVRDDWGPPTQGSARTSLHPGLRYAATSWLFMSRSHWRKCVISGFVFIRVHSRFRFLLVAAMPRWANMSVALRAGRRYTNRSEEFLVITEALLGRPWNSQTEQECTLKPDEPEFIHSFPRSR